MDAIDFYFDFMSPYSYLAHSQLGTLGAPIRFVPISVLPLMKLVNNTPTTLLCEVKRNYAGKDLLRWVARYGVPYRPGNLSRLDRALLLQVVTVAEDVQTKATATDAIFNAVWGGSGDASPEGLEGLLSTRGLAGAALIAAAQREAAAEALTAATQAAADDGVFGAPTLRVGAELFFGNDRLDFVREAIARTGENAA